MKLSFFPAALCLLISPVFAAPTAPTSPSARWLTNAQTALDLGKRTNRPVLLNFGTTWCSGCHQLDKTTFKSAAFAQESRNWVLVKIDAEKGATNIALDKKYRIRGYPTLVLLSSTGRELNRIEGFLPARIVPAMNAARRQSGAKPKAALRR